ncbi:hypothetical protein AQUCO_01500161v1 [Aquilegia coerulea]|uniref:Uncharacterized protein n=1 Tax=Aquilegia coerulea TaxID=218851 RepID=A0A2G5DSC9_AQUCA|nr:hypothetical protein AQUCO_01500161v1 [Aquilegia coerulea]
MGHLKLEWAYVLHVMFRNSMSLLLLGTASKLSSDMQKCFVPISFPEEQNRKKTFREFGTSRALPMNHPQTNSENRLSNNSNI